MKLSTLLSIMIVSAFALPVWADDAASTSTPAIDQHAANQAQRIQQGEKSGTLTHKEAKHLQRRETKLASDEAAAKADGKITPKERAHLKREEQRDNNEIYRKKHNERVNVDH